MGDGSSIEVACGGPEGNDRISTMMFITAYDTGLHIKTFEAGLGYEGECTIDHTCAYNWTEPLLADNLPLHEWHKVELEMRCLNQDYGQKWTYSVNGEQVYSGGSYLEAYYLAYRDTYGYINRIKIKPRHAVNDASFLGFYFDDIYYEAFDWSNRDNILDYYETSFEN